jgi:hypothetical protein
MPGVPGERVHREAGFICLVENLPKQSSALTAAAAVQVLDDRQLRLHGIIQIEQWHPSGNTHSEPWRVARTAPADEAGGALATLLTELRAAVDAAGPEFDEQRGQMPEEAG